MDDSYYIMRYLNNLNITTFGFIKNPNHNTRPIYWFQGKNDAQELIEGNVTLNIDGVNITYSTLSGSQHVFDCKFSYVNSSDYEVHTTHTVIENGQPSIINIKISKNTPKNELFKNLFECEIEDETTNLSKPKQYSLVI